MSVLKFDSYDDVIERANNSNFGLGAGVITKDCKKKKRKESESFEEHSICILVSRALQFAEQLQAGSVWVNQYGGLQFPAPFGGFKQSGHGRELGRYSLESYYEVKTVLIKIE